MELVKAANDIEMAATTTHMPVSDVGVPLATDGTHRERAAFVAPAQPCSRPPKSTCASAGQNYAPSFALARVISELRFFPATSASRNPSQRLQRRIRKDPDKRPGDGRRSYRMAAGK